MTSVLFYGLGYSATVIAQRLAARGATIVATSRTPHGAARITELGYRAVPIERSGTITAFRENADASVLDTLTHLIVSAPPDAHGDPLLAAHAADLARATQLKWIGYLSTVGVYGDHQGAWVDETTPPASASQRSTCRLAAEQSWQAFAERTGERLAIFRLAGIYGPGRSPLDQLRTGIARRIVKPGQVFNRIHVDDIATTVLAAIEQNADGLFNVSDDEPAPPQDVVAHAAGLLGVPVPPEIPFDTADLSEMAASFYADCKRVANARIKSALGVTLTYPTYREGLAAIARRGTAQG